MATTCQSEQGKENEGSWHVHLMFLLIALYHPKRWFYMKKQISTFIISLRYWLFLSFLLPGCWPPKKIRDLMSGFSSVTLGLLRYLVDSSCFTRLTKIAWRGKEALKLIIIGISKARGCIIILYAKKKQFRSRSMHVSVSWGSSDVKGTYIEGKTY